MTAFAVSMRPAALMRGAMRKATCVAVGTEPAKPDTSSSARSPGLRTERSPSRPCLTISRFSPVNGTTSATVPIATSLRNDSMTRRTLPAGQSSVANRPCTSLNATPTPQRLFSGYVQPGRLGLRTASARGSSASGRWWSVMITSTPSAVARSTTCAARIPVSTLTMSRAPSLAAASTTSGRMPYPSLRR